MTWVKDYNERLVNIDNWDFLDAITITDMKTGLPALWKIFLSRGKEEYILGYEECGNKHFEDLLESLSKGVGVNLKSIESSLYYYLDKEFDKTFEEMTKDNFDREYNKRYREIDKLIDTRFKEDE